MDVLNDVERHVLEQLRLHGRRMSAGELLLKGRAFAVTSPEGGQRSLRRALVSLQDKRLIDQFRFDGGSQATFGPTETGIVEAGRIEAGRAMAGRGLAGLRYP